MGDGQITDTQLEDVLHYINHTETDPTKLRQIRLDVEKRESLFKPHAVKKMPHEWSVEMAELLKGYVIERYPHYEKSAKITEWALDIERIPNMSRLISQDVIKAVIVWLFTVDNNNTRFWRTNIRSGGKLKEHFMRLYELAKEDLERTVVII